MASCVRRAFCQAATRFTTTATAIARKAAVKTRVMLGAARGRPAGSWGAANAGGNAVASRRAERGDAGAPGAICWEVIAASYTLGPRARFGKSPVPF